MPHEGQLEHVQELVRDGFDRNFDVFRFELTNDELEALDPFDTGVCGGPPPEAITREAFAATSPKPETPPRTRGASTQILLRPATVKNPPERFTGDAWLDPLAAPGDDGKVESRAGDTLYCPPRQEHWHGAAPDSFVEHLAMLDQGRPPGHLHDLARARHRRGLQRLAG